MSSEPASSPRATSALYPRRLFYAVFLAALASLAFLHFTATQPAAAAAATSAAPAAPSAHPRDANVSDASSAASAASSSSESSSQTGDARCLLYGAAKEVGEAGAAAAVCKIVHERVTGPLQALSRAPAAAEAASCRRLGYPEGQRRASVGERNAAGLREGVTVVVPTYKGHETMRHAVATWRQSGFLAHPDVTDVIVRMNSCSCSDRDMMRDDIWAFASAPPYNLNVTVLCGSGNWLFARHLIGAVLEVETTMFIQTENDRPMLRRTNESAAVYQARVRSGLDTAIGAMRNGSCAQALPYVHLHRMHMTGPDEAMHRAWRESGLPRSARPVELTRPHQKPGDVTECWAECSDAVEEYRTAANKTAYLERGCLAGGVPKCRLWVCRELAMWIEEDPTKRSGAGSDTDGRNRNLMCLTNFVRAAGVHREGVRRLSRGRVSTAEEIERPADGSALHWWAEKRLVRFQREPLLLCYKTAHHVNAPALYDTAFYLSHVATRLCATPTKSGMSVGRGKRVRTKKGTIFKPAPTYFQHYSKQLEYFQMQHFADDIACYVDGLTEHIELESYDGTSIDAQ